MLSSTVSRGLHCPSSTRTLFFIIELGLFKPLEKKYPNYSGGLSGAPVLDDVIDFPWPVDSYT